MISTISFMPIVLKTPHTELSILFMVAISVHLTSYRHDITAAERADNAPSAGYKIVTKIV